MNMEQSTPVVPGLVPLLDHLSGLNSAAGTHGLWHYTRIEGGANNLIYRATSPEYDTAIKWTIRDARDRAGREWAALRALAAAGLDCAPMPLFLDRERYAQPVVVQSWLVGTVEAAPPSTDAEWQAFLAHYLTIHSLTPGRCAQPLPPATLNMHSVADGFVRIAQQLACLPTAARAPELVALVHAAETRDWPRWPTPPFALCRVDSNTRNFVRRAGGWASVDWENGGWGDPAFEVVDIITHLAYAGVPAERWEWLIDAYARGSGDAGAETRIRAYLPLMLVWWVARLARVLYEVPRGGDQRLAGRTPAWQAETEAHYLRYVQLARAAV